MSRTIIVETKSSRSGHKKTITRSLEQETRPRHNERSGTQTTGGATDSQSKQSSLISETFRPSGDQVRRRLGVSFDFATLEPEPVYLSVRQKFVKLDLLICDLEMVANKHLRIRYRVGNGSVQFARKAARFFDVKQVADWLELRHHWSAC
jgi:hypothetical protein